jgi:hypothetical protein
VDTLVLQADLTAVVPGLPTAELAGLLRLAAEPESTGAASVFRFSADSVRRYLDAGGGADDLIGALARRGSVPQPLAYLVQDVARRHADLRIGAAQTYLRCDDPVMLAGILADPGAAALGLFRLAETVLASPQPPEHVLGRLRHLGHWPQPDPGRGPARPPARRARGAPHAVEPAAGAMTPALAAAAVRAMRASERPRTGGRGAGGAGDAEAAGRAGSRAAQAAGPHPIPGSDPAAVVAALRAAIAEDRPVWIGYADPTGVAADRRVEPLRLSGGYLTALDLRTEAIDSFAVARITGVLPT